MPADISCPPVSDKPVSGFCPNYCRGVSRDKNLLAAIYLGPLLPMGSSHLLRAGRAGLEYRNSALSTVLLRIEFTATDCLQPSSEPLPHFSTLAKKRIAVFGGISLLHLS